MHGKQIKNKANSLLDLSMRNPDALMFMISRCFRHQSAKPLGNISSSHSREVGHNQHHREVEGDEPDEKSNVGIAASKFIAVLHVLSGQLSCLKLEG